MRASSSPPVRVTASLARAACPGSCSASSRRSRPRSWMRTASPSSARCRPLLTTMVPRREFAHVILVEGLRKSFGATHAVDGDSFSARDGQITALLGANGAGKTTTLRMLYTLMRPDAGRILVDGIDAQQDALAVRRLLGVLPDARGLYRRL